MPSGARQRFTARTVGLYSKPEGFIMPTGVYSRATPEMRFWKKVSKTVTCWHWTGAVNSGGYGCFWDGNKFVVAHRFAYEILIGPIAAGFTLDHLCRVRPCVNPTHLDVVTLRVNTLRGDTIVTHNMQKTHCVHGHPFDLFNTYFRRDGARACRQCRSQRQKAPAANSS